MIYDVPEYQYAGKTYCSRNYTTNLNSMTSSNPVLTSNSTYHYYVTYEPRPAAKQGGDITTANDYPDEPIVTKNSVENPNTGTNTISLEVTGNRKTMNPSKADIIVIYDISGSMKFPIGFNSLEDIEAPHNGYYYMIDDGETLPPWGAQRNHVVKESIKTLATELMENNTDNDPAVRMALVPFSTNAGSIIDFTGDADDFNDSVESFKTQLNGGTNWEDALQTANSIQVRSDADAYVIFVTDGTPTFRISRQGATDGQLSSINGLSGISYGNNTVNEYINSGLFGTGNADTVSTSPDSLERNYQAALSIARSIVGNNKRLYGIGISEEAQGTAYVKGLSKLINESGTSGKYYDGNSESDVLNAVKDIKKEIKEITFGYSDVQINDGITALTQTVKKTGMTTLPDSDDFEYFKGHAATQDDVAAGKASIVGEMVWEPWTETQMSEEGAGLAKYEDGAVKWNLGETFMLEDGVSYKVDFTVWPSQEALDILADINNSCRRDKATGQLTVYASSDAAYESLPEDIKAQIYKSGGKYVLKTNEDDAGYSYKKATQEEGGLVTPQGNPIPGTFDPVIPLKLRSDSIGVEKSFSNLLDSRDPTQIQLELWGNRLYKTFTLTKDGQWKSDNNYISCGLLTVDKETGVLYVYETGHDFTLKETGEDSIYWELTADTYHPMIINDVLHMLSKADAPEEMDPETKYLSTGGKEYYKIDGQVYVDEGTDAVLKAVNDHRSFLDLRKEVVNNAGDVTTCDDYFSFKAKFNESRVNDDIIFTVYDTVNKQYISDQDITSAALTPADDETNTTPYFKVGNKTEFTLKIKQGWNVRFLNLSNDTTYDIEEALGQDYEFVKIEGSAVKTVKTTGEATSGSGATSQATVNHHMTITSGQKKMSGTIAEPNVQYSIKYTNKPKPVDFSFSKIWLDMQANVNEIDEDDLQEWDTSKTISVVLKRYTEKGEDSDFSLKYTINSGDGPFKPTNDSLSEDEKTKYQLTKTAESKITSFKLEAVLDRKDPEGKVYTYYVVEESAVGNNTYYGEINENDEITLTPGAKSAQKGKVIINQESIGYELPSTGGMGTTIFYLTGFALIFGASVCLLRRRTKSAA
ncbi:MAG: VWA domain-containing protein [Blautia sp.]|nr:VWA domain-containing protein [Blautia sp.]